MLSRKMRKSIYLIATFFIASNAAITVPVQPEDPAYRQNNNSISNQNLTVVSGLSADQLWKKFFTDTLPPGVKITKISYTGTPKASGSYAGMPYLNAIKPKDGILVTSGTPETALGPNDDDGASVENKTAGYQPIEQIGGSSWKSYDAAYLSIEFSTDTTIKGISFDFVYGSEEFSEFVGSMFNDVFAAFLDGKNISFDSNKKPITVNNNFFKIDNETNPNTLYLQYDGFTPLLRTSDSIKAGNHTLVFAIADLSDRILDSGVFLSNFQFKFTQGGTNPVKNILDDQTFTVKERSPAGTFVGKVKIVVPDSVKPVITPLKTLPQFTYNTASREITVAPGAVLDFKVQNKYLLPMEGKVTINNITVRDSAMMTIMVLEVPIIPTVPYIDSAVVYDRNGNGIGDSALIVFKSDFKPAVPDKMLLQWPPATTAPYDLKLEAQNISGTKILCVPYTPNAGETVVTKGEGYAKVTIDSVGTKVVREAKVLDGIGPLLTHAVIIERFAPGNDTFFVDCTEEVNASDISGEAFILIKNFGTPYQKEIVLPLIGKAVDQGGEKSLLFAVGDIGADAVQAGDHLKFNAKGVVRDKRQNRPHPDNTPVPIKVNRRPNRVVQATYHDMDGNGMVDTVRMEFTKKVADISEIICTVTWSDNKNAVLKDLHYDTQNDRILKGYIGSLFDTEYLRDRTGGAMMLSVTYKQVNNQVIQYPVLDKAAPVIRQGTYVYGMGIARKGESTEPAKDSLIVLFSEPVAEISALKPFMFVQKGKQYILELALLQTSGAISSFRVKGPANASMPMEGDSMWIECTAGVGDALKNIQELKDNKHAPVLVRYKPIDFKIYVIGPHAPEEYEIPDILKPENAATFNHGIPIILDPTYSIPDNLMDQIKIRIVIYDCLGNVLGEGKQLGVNDYKTIHIFKTKKMQYNKFVILWSGENQYGRMAGGGAYTAMVYIENRNNTPARHKIMIPVRRSTN